MCRRLHHEDELVRTCLVDALRFHGFDDDPDWLSFLEDCLADPDAEVRSIAVVTAV